MTGASRILIGLGATARDLPFPLLMAALAAALILANLGTSVRTALMSPAQPRG